MDDLLGNQYNIQAVEDNLQYNIEENENATENTIIRKEVLKYIQRYPDNEVFPEVMIWMMMRQKNYEDALVQVKALDKRQHGNGAKALTLARTCVTNEAYPVAHEAFQYVLDFGPKGDNYIQARVEQLKADYLEVINGGAYSNEQITALQSKYVSALADMGKSPETVPLMLDLAHLEAFYLHNDTEAIAIMNDAIALPSVASITRGRCKMELADILLASGEIWEASLNYSKVEKEFKENPLGDEAKYKNAVIYFYTGNFSWAKAELDILKAATTKLIANDAMALSLVISDNIQDSSSNTLPLRLYASAMLNDFCNYDDTAAQLLDSISNISASNPLKEEVLDMRGSIAEKQGKYEEAKGFYEAELNQFPTGMLPDKALYNLGKLEEKKLHNPDKAAEYYHQLILKYPGSFYVEEGRNGYRRLSKEDKAPDLPVN
jgi:tetratricopeptide (TPR) repeat protein